MQLQTRKAKKADGWHSAWGWSLLGLSIAIAGIYYALPVEDGDLWFHLAYGRYFIENKTLIPDHTLFSWTPSDNKSLYCAWLSEIILYLIHQFAGLWALFALRYLGLSVFLLAFWGYSYRLGLFSHPLTGLISLIAILMSNIGLYIKPELFSFVFFTIIVGLWWHIKSSRHPKSGYLCYLFPLIMAVWVNCHGVFLFGAAFLAAVGAGEVLNARFSPGSGVSSAIRRHLHAAIALCFLTILMTPYGVDYPLHLLKGIYAKLFTEMGMVDYHQITAYGSILDEPKSANFVSFLVSLAILIPLSWRVWKQKGIDWAAALTNALFLVLACWLKRSSYYWVSVFSFHALYVLHQLPGWRYPPEKAPRWLLCTTVISLCALFSISPLLRLTGSPVQEKWLGFGISYQNPVAEAAFIKEHFSRGVLGNTYGPGGYLLWHLWPETKVMMDPRYFPYKSWFNEYAAFASGKNMEAFFSKYECDVWCVDFDSPAIIQKLYDSPDWRLVFYGPSAAVFAKKEKRLPELPMRCSESLFEIRNFDRARKILLFSIMLKDFRNSGRLLSHVREHFPTFHYGDHTNDLADFLDGMVSKHEGDYPKAVWKLEQCRRRGNIHVKEELIESYHKLAAENWRNGKDEMALESARKGFSLNEKDPYSLYNVGVMEWYLMEYHDTRQSGNRARSGPETLIPASDPANRWKGLLTEFLSLIEKSRGSQEPIVKLVREIIEGRYAGRPPLLVRPEKR